MARDQPRPRVGPLQFLIGARRAEARADCRRCPSGPPPGALPAAIDISASRGVRSAAECRAATTWCATSSDRALARCSSCGARCGGARGRAQIAATAHHVRLRGRSAALSVSTDRGASNALLYNVLQPYRPPPAAPARRGAASRCDSCSRGRAQTAAIAHHGRLRGRSAAPSASMARGASNEPKVDVEEEVGRL